MGLVSGEAHVTPTYAAGGPLRALTVSRYHPSGCTAFGDDQGAQEKPAHGFRWWQPAEERRVGFVGLTLIVRVRQVRQVEHWGAPRCGLIGQDCRVDRSVVPIRLCL